MSPMPAGFTWFAKTEQSLRRVALVSSPDCVRMCKFRVDHPVWSALTRDNGWRRRTAPLRVEGSNNAEMWSS